MILTDNSKQGAIAVTPSDDDNIIFPSGINATRGIYIGGAGNLAVRMIDGTEVTFTAVIVGAMYDLAVIRVLDTGTTASDIVAVY